MDAFNRLVATCMPWFPKPIVGYLSRHYIAGASLDDAVRVSKALISEGCSITLDVLGEHIEKPEEATAYADLYLKILDRIAADKLDANVSVKPTQMGLALDATLCEKNYESIVSKAAEYQNFVRIDMEDTPWTDATFDLHDRMRAAHEGHVGVVIQSYLRRTLSDIQDRLIPKKTHLRLCKGIYKEPLTLAFHSYDEIRAAYLKDLRALLEAGNFVGIATHDDFLVEGAFKIIRDLNLEPDRYEFQMLLGVLPNLRRRILQAGHKLRVYVPFGESWFAYSSRRLKENPDLVSHFIKGLFRKHR
jgi:proline dehydrogenase